MLTDMFDLLRIIYEAASCRWGQQRSVQTQMARSAAWIPQLACQANGVDQRWL
jgi:hypothetical protein